MKLACAMIGLTAANVAAAQDVSSPHVEFRVGALVAAQALHDGDRRYEIDPALAFGASARVFSRAQTAVRISADIAPSVASQVITANSSQTTLSQLLVHFGVDAMRVVARRDAATIDAGLGFAMRTLQGADFVCTNSPCQPSFPALPLAGRLRTALRLRFARATAETAVFTGRDRGAWHSYVLTMLGVGL